MVDVTITTPIGSIEFVIDMINPEIDENFTVMEYKPLNEDLIPPPFLEFAREFQDLAEGHLLRKVETNKSKLYKTLLEVEAAEGGAPGSFKVSWRNQADGSQGTWFDDLGGSVSVSVSMP